MKIRITAQMFLYRAEESHIGKDIKINNIKQNVTICVTIITA